MFTANGEKLNPRDPHWHHQANGGKALLASLLKPFMGKTPRYDSIRQVLVATAAGHITAEQAQKEIERIQLRRRACTLTGPFELTVESLQAGCTRLQNACMRTECALETFCRRLDQACKELDDKLNQRY